MRIKPWGTLGALGLICALMIGCNNNNRQPDKTLGASSGNPPAGKSFAGTGVPPGGGAGSGSFPLANSGQKPPFSATSGPGVPGGMPSLIPPGPGGSSPTPGGIQPSNSSAFVPPNLNGGPNFGGPPPIPPPNVTPQNPGAFGGDRIPPASPSPFQGVKIGS